MWTPFVTIVKRLDSKLFKEFESLKRTSNDFSRQHTGENLSIGWRHAFEQKINRMLIGNRVGSRALIPYPCMHPSSSNLSLALFANANQLIDQLSVNVRLSECAHFGQEP